MEIRKEKGKQKKKTGNRCATLSGQIPLAANVGRTQSQDSI